MVFLGADNFSRPLASCMFQTIIQLCFVMQEQKVSIASKITQIPSTSHIALAFFKDSNRIGRVLGITVNVFQPIFDAQVYQQ